MISDAQSAQLAANAFEVCFREVPAMIRHQFQDPLYLAISGTALFTFHGLGDVKSDHRRIQRQ